MRTWLGFPRSLVTLVAFVPVLTCTASSSGAPPSVLAPAWNRPYGGSVAAYDALAKTAVVLGSSVSGGMTVIGVSASTGERRWGRLFPEFHDASALGEVRDGLLTLTTSASGASVILRLRVSDGRLVSQWRAPESDALALLPDGDVVTRSAPGLESFDPDRSRRRWGWRPAGGCRLVGGPAVTPEFVAVQQDCDGQQTIAAVALDGQTVLWKRKLADPQFFISSENGLVLVNGTGWFTVLDGDGQILASRTARCLGRCIQVDKNDVLLTYASGHTEAVELLSRADGTTAWVIRRPAPIFDADAFLLRDTVVLIDRHAWRDVFTVLDRSTSGRRSTSTDDVAYSSGTVFGGDLYATGLDGHGDPRLTRLRLGDHASGGAVVEEDGPAACGLLDAAGLADLAGATPGDPEIRYSPVRRGPACVFVPTSRRVPAVTVEVTWSASSAEKAREFIDAAPDNAFAGQVPGLGRDAAWVFPQAGTTSTSAVVRMDTHVVRVDVNSSNERAVALLTRIAGKLAGSANDNSGGS